MAEEKLIYSQDELPQGSDSWNDFRNKGIGGSEASALMGIGFQSINELFASKTGRAEPVVMNDAMRRGHALEPKARAKYEEITGHGTMEPMCLVHPEYPFLRASLDGISPDRKMLVEIKCPGINTHTKAVRGNIPDYYVPQVQQQLLIAEALFGTKKADYFSYFPVDPLFSLGSDNEGVLLPVEPNPEYQAELIRRAKIFWGCVLTDTPPNPTDFPPFTDATVVERNDAEWKKAAQKLIKLNAKLKTLQAEVDAATESLKSMANSVQADKVVGWGIEISKVSRVGSVDYSAIPQLQGIDLESYRKAPSSYLKIKIGEVE